MVSWAPRVEGTTTPVQYHFSLNNALHIRMIHAIIEALTVQGNSPSNINLEDPELFVYNVALREAARRDNSVIVRNVVLGEIVD